MKHIVCLSNPNLDSMYFSKRKTVNPKLKHMILKCSNPLLKETKECVALWNELHHFNNKINGLEYSIKNIDAEQTNNFIFDKTCDDQYTEECRIYED